MSIETAELLSSFSGLPYPRLRLKQADRAHFMFLTDGNDDYFEGGRFHRVTKPGNKFATDVACMRALTNGEEECVFCEAGDENLASRFACWVYVFDIYHRFIDVDDDEDGERPQWEEVQLDGRIYYKEPVNGARLLWLPYGRQRAWFNQFRTEYDIRGRSLANKLYALIRRGSGRDNTDYRLIYLEDKKPTKDVLEAASDIVPIKEVFATTYKMNASSSRSVAKAVAQSLAIDDDDEEDEDVVTALSSRKRGKVREAFDVDEEDLV